MRRFNHILFLLLLFPFSVLADVHLPTGEYRERVVDMQVKVRGGVVRVERSWQADDLNRGRFRWHPNPAWDDLHFEMDVIDGVPKTIVR